MLMLIIATCMYHNCIRKNNIKFCRFAFSVN